MGRTRTVVVSVGLALLVGSAAGAAPAAPAKPATKPATKPASRSALEVLASAPVKTVASKTAKVDMDMDFRFGVQGKSLDGSMRVTGALDFSGSRMAMTMDMTDFVKSIAAAAGPQAQKQLASLGDMTYEMRMAQRLLYMRMPKIATTSLGLTKPWIRIDLALLGADASVIDSVTNQAGGSPYEALGYLSGVSSTGLTTVGREKVRGVDTTHYRGTIDVAKSITESAALRRQMGLATADASELVQLLGRTVSFDAWIDDAGRLRRQVLPMSFSQQGISGSMTMAMEYYDFGAELKIALPSASETVDASTVPALWSELKKNAKA